MQTFTRFPLVLLTHMGVARIVVRIFQYALFVKQRQSVYCDPRLRRVKWYYLILGQQGVKYLLLKLSPRASRGYTKS